MTDNPEQTENQDPSMIERATVVFFETLWRGLCRPGWGWETASPDLQGAYLKAMRAAIAALRKPNEALE